MWTGVQADRVITVADNVMKKLCGLENTAGKSVSAERLSALALRRSLHLDAAGLKRPVPARCTGGG